ncbi:hypothetical protein DPEC_G00282390 [Dallia pectoralis]|uniref:Uncharacterized protein n=1 Tax=Dallia pectoralis TaxID=75939 RepID=A0ACC2FN22_DALPE|nr:hypothetical protein DPEC_G00282390 [Dallia pectoralis]
MSDSEEMDLSSLEIVEVKVEALKSVLGQRVKELKADFVSLGEEMEAGNRAVIASTTASCAEAEAVQRTGKAPISRGGSNGGPARAEARTRTPDRATSVPGRQPSKRPSTPVPENTPSLDRPEPKRVRLVERYEDFATAEMAESAGAQAGKSSRKRAPH